MIESIESMKKALELAKDNFGRTAIEVCKNYEPEIIDMNTDQLDKGIRADGSQIEPGYTPFTVSLKKQKGQPTSTVTLKDTGDFHDAFFINFGSNYLAIGSSDSKATKLENKYGRDIFGLTDQNIDELRELIEDDFVEQIREQVLS